MKKYSREKQFSGSAFFCNKINLCENTAIRSGENIRKSLETSNMLLDDLLKHIVEKMEGLYTHWFLGQLGNNWSDA